ncbi:acetylornithine transaminase [Plesiomonas sp.]|uniref:acetylornithine transaminase n=1 Tax=Plesiomonas sp. TaxID=2486279 RepID=UPI003F3E5D0B
MTSLNTDALMSITHRPDLYFTRGKGHWLYTEDNSAYLDFVQGWAVNCLGHCPDVLIQALHTQAQQLINPSPAFFNQPMAELATRLTELSGLDKVFFTNSGAEANESAIKLARRYGQKHKNGAYKIVTFDNSFHGRTLGTMSATGKPQFAPLFEPKVPGFIKVPFNDIAAVKNAITADTVAIMLEPIQGEAGVIPAERAFMQALRQLCDEEHLLLIVDEVQTGIGRTGKMFAFERFGVMPDMVTLGKGLGGGIPLAAHLAREHVCCFEPGDQGGTYNGNPLMCAGGLAVVNTVAQERFLQNIDASSALLVAGLKRLSQEFDLGEIRGEGLLLAFDLKYPIAEEAVKEARFQHLLLNAPRPNILRFMPALTLTEHEINVMLTRLQLIIHSLVMPYKRAQLVSDAISG